MSLHYLDPETIGTSLSCAWRTQLNTSESPSNDGKWLTNGANDDGIGLYGGLTDSVPGSVTLDTSSATVSTRSITCATVVVDNRNGTNPGGPRTLSYSAGTTTSETHTATTSVSSGTKFTIAVNEVVSKDGAQFPVDFTFVSTDTSAEMTSNAQTFAGSTEVQPPAGKVYEAVLTAETQQITIPYTVVISVTGTTETWFDDTVNGHYNYSTDAGTAFGWIASHDCAGTDSSSYSNGGSGIGKVTLTGTVTVSQTVNFAIAVNDITATYSG